MVRAIRAIAQGPVETKSHITSNTLDSLLTTSGYTTGAAFGLRGPIHHHIPRFKNTSTQTESSFIGNQIQLRGFRFELNAFAQTATALPDDKFRFTIFSQTENTTILPQILGADVADNDYLFTYVWFKWDMQKVNIHYRRTFGMGEASVGGGHIKKKFYWRANRKLTTVNDESTVVNSFFGGNKNRNYYWALEILSPLATNLTAQLEGQVNTTVYFKDA